jgi:erythrocyte band 7 integral membrane protein
MAAEAEATREARAKVIAAEGEHRASRSLRDAADILSESSSAIQLRYLQTLNNIAGEKNSTIVFPLPIEIFSGFMNNKSPNVKTIKKQSKFNETERQATSNDSTEL